MCRAFRLAKCCCIELCLVITTKWRGIFKYRGLFLPFLLLSQLHGPIRSLCETSVYIFSLLFQPSVHLCAPCYCTFPYRLQQPANFVWMSDWLGDCLKLLLHISCPGLHKCRSRDRGGKYIGRLGQVYSEGTTRTIRLDNTAMAEQDTKPDLRL